MDNIVIRRTFNLGNFESLSIERPLVLEGIGEAEDLNRARLLATKQILEAAQKEMIRIFNLRVQNITGNPYTQVELELAGIKAELGE
jgi:hypothetical protein